MTDKPNSQNKSDQDKKVQKSKTARLIRRGLLLLLISPILMFFLIQIPIIQNWVVGKTTDYLSKKLETQVSLEKVSIGIYEGLALENLYVESLDGDTLLYCSSLTTSLTKSLYHLVNNQLGIDEIMLRGAQINIVRYKEQERNSLFSLLSKISSGKSSTTKGKSNFFFDINNIYLQDVQYKNLDEVTGDKQFVSVEHGILEIDKFLDQNKLDFRRLILTNPVIQIEKLLESFPLEQEKKVVKNELVDIKQIKEANLIIQLDKLQINNGVFSFIDRRIENIDHKTPRFDYHNLQLSKLNVKANDFNFSGVDCINLELKNLSFIDQNNFELKKFSSEFVNVEERVIEFKKLDVQTTESKVTDYFAFRISSLNDFSNFTNMVNIDMDLIDSELAVSDILYFVPGLNNNDFFIKNKAKKIKVSGIIRNPINRLNGKNVQLSIDDHTYFYGNFNTRNLTNSKEALLNIKVNELATDMYSLSKVVPNFKPPENFNKLGRLMFNGRFDGYLKDFVAYGALTTDLGIALMDINLDIQNGNSNARYSGELELQDFDLGAWSDNKDLGIVNFESIIDNGQGLTLETAFADLDATVAEFNYKNYTYRDFVMSGKLDKNQFSGRFSIEDPNAHLTFDGEIFIQDSIPTFDFEAKVENLDLQKLNLSDQTSQLKGKLNIKSAGRDLFSVDGSALLQDLHYTNQDTTYALENILITSFIKDQQRTLEIESDIGTIFLKGNMNIKEMGESVKKVLKTSYPEHFKNLDVDYAKSTSTQNFEYQVNVSDSKNLLGLLNLKDYSLQNLAVSGFLDNRNNEIQLEGQIEKFIHKSDTIYNAAISSFNLNRIGKLELAVDSMYLQNRFFSPIALRTDLNEDRLDFRIESREVFDSLDYFDISGTLQVIDDGYSLTLDDSNLEMFGSSWNFKEGNLVNIGNKRIEIEGFVLTDGYRDIKVDDIDNKGLEILLDDFNFLTINGLIGYDKIDFAGEGFVSFSIDNIFDRKSLSLNMQVPKFTLNDQDYGSLLIQGGKRPGEPYAVTIDVSKDNGLGVQLNAQIDETTKKVTGRLDAARVPFTLFEMIIPDGISEAEGEIRAYVDISGTLDDVHLLGEFKLMNGGVKVDYIGEKYFSSNQPVRVTENYLDFSGGVITDHLGNPAIIQGGMKHNFLSNFDMDVRLSGPDIIILNTTAKDNPLYYGLGRGYADVSFKGPFSQTDMVINAVTGPQSHLSIPVTYYETGYEESFIQFVNKDDLLNRGPDIDLEQFKIEGIDIEMNVTVTPDALLKIIFNEKLNDVIRGRGIGDIQVFLTRSGEFLTYGDYTIESGEYLFTALGIVAKSFKVQPGGTIKWTGDPIDASLDIKAEYADLRSSLSVFLEEYIGDSEALLAEARQRTDVDLLLNLGGTLYKPDIKFDLNFPNIESPSLRSFVATKMTALRADPITLNDQVAGLIMFNTFLPSSNSRRINSYTGNAALGTVTSTLSEFVSNQVSFLLSSFTNGLVEESNFFSSIDVDVGVSQNDNFSGESKVLDIFRPDEFGANVNTRFKFLNEKFSLRLGYNNIKNSNLSADDRFSVGDLAIEYDITDDRKLRLRLYNRFDRDEASNLPKNRSGLGIFYRKEFGSIVDFKNELFEKVKLEETQ